MSDAFMDAMAAADAPVVDDAAEAPSDLVEAVASLQPGEDVGEAPVEDESPNDGDVADPAEELDDESWRSRYENLQSKIGEQGKELGELRKLREQWEARLAAEEAAAQAVDVPENPLAGYSPKQITDYIAEVADANPLEAQQQAAAFFGHALESGDLTLARKIARTVESSVDDTMADRMYDLIDDAKLEQRLAPLQQAHQQSAEQRAVHAATDDLIARHPDAAELAQPIAELVQTNQAVARLLELGEHAQAFEVAYALAKTNSGPALSSSVQATASADYKQSTAVSSGESRVAPPADPQAAAEDYVADMLRTRSNA